jgi:hypothetical protein
MLPPTLQKRKAIRITMVATLAPLPLSIDTAAQVAVLVVVLGKGADHLDRPLSMAVAQFEARPDTCLLDDISGDYGAGRSEVLLFGLLCNY